ncbi:acyltransferase [Chryseobacterium sp.]|uniref:acyltransferase family protein n=1 Tax=Chryseobacterium sp. TaxID=1871047 RepID=UPI002FCC6725
MNNLNLKNHHRKDIDGLRAIAVLAVIIFHVGFLPMGYLGVDVFFVISGYLITKIIYKETLSGNFSIINFYLRRIRRIIPLVLFVVIITLIIGLLVMLPDDLENLSQSIIATNFMANNILLLITTGNYWDSVNDFKPLMHTWSLGIEEQFYFIVPLLFLLLGKKRISWAIWILTIFSVVSLIMFVLPSIPSASKFYLIQYRFFELAVGSLFGILFLDKLISFPFRWLLLLLLILLITVDLNLDPNIALILVVFISGILLISNVSSIEKLLLENRYAQFIGKISFSLYMWHQIVLAFGRYFVYPSITSPLPIIVVLSLTFILSVLTYYFIETPFRDKKRIGNKTLLSIVLISTIITSGVSFYIYSIKGIINDVPELNMYKSEVYQGNAHIKYNEEIYKLDQDFKSVGKTKILVIGDSFARDWANILLESKNKNNIEISYIFDLNEAKNSNNRIKQADVIYFSELDYQMFLKICSKYNINKNKVWNVGTKNFGTNNGIYYNNKGDENYCMQKTKMADGFLEKNSELKRQWKDRYIDLIGLLIDSNNKLPVFTKECKFISQDCRHLTKPGAIYIANLLENDLRLKFQK